MATKPDHPVWEGHRRRLRQRSQREGWDALRPHEMVELVLNYAVPRQNLSDVARALVEHFGSVGGVFAASRERLAAVEGMTSALIEWVALTGELMRAYYDLHAETDIRLSCWQEMLAFLRPRLGEAARPGLWAIYADFDFNLITFSDLPVDGDAAVAARRMLVEAIAAGARYVYLVRFAESGAPGPDAQALSRIEAVAETLRAADIDLVDCVRVDGADVRSLRVEGLLNLGERDGQVLALREYGGEGNEE